MPAIRTIALCLALTIAATFARAELAADRQGTQVRVRGDHFRLTIDAARGGEITSIQLFDGSAWNSVVGRDHQTCPMLTLRDTKAAYALASDRKARITNYHTTPDKVTVAIAAVPTATDGTRSPWAVTLAYEIHPEGAVFIDLHYRLEAGEFALAASELSLALDKVLARCPKFRPATMGGKACFPSARVAFGTNPIKSFTNEIEMMVEARKPIAGTMGFRHERGRFRWTLGSGGASLKAPMTYHNRVSIGLGAAATGKPRTQVVGQRVHHWVNFLDKKNWYPTNKQIDRMVANHSTMLILHHEWMRQRGSNGYPHANYAVVRNRDEMVRCIAYAHAKGLRVGLYMRGVEPYGLDARFFETYCRRNWDGIYVDWHGPLATAYHDNKYKPDAKFADKHFSADGHRLPGKDYFLFTKRLRQVVGPRGFLIGHMGPFHCGILANLTFDAYLPGETGSDHAMLADRDQAVFKGMMGGVACMPWTLDSGAYRTPEGAAKMAAWGLYPHLVMGIRRNRKNAPLFTRDPDAPEFRFVLPYWRVLAAIDVEGTTVLNLPSHNVVAATSSAPDIQCVVYKHRDGSCLLVVANLGRKPSSATITLNRQAIGLSGKYQVTRIDSATGKPSPHGTSSDTVATTVLPQWGIEGYKLTRHGGTK